MCVAAPACSSAGAGADLTEGAERVNWGQLPGTLTEPPRPGNIRRPMQIRLCCCDLWEEIMRRTLSMLAIGLCANALVGLSALAQPAPELTITRLHRGTRPAPTCVGLRFTDTYSHTGLN